MERNPLRHWGAQVFSWSSPTSHSHPPTSSSPPKLHPGPPPQTPWQAGAPTPVAQRHTWIPPNLFQSREAKSQRASHRCPIVNWNENLLQMIRSPLSCCTLCNTLQKNHVKWVPSGLFSSRLSYHGNNLTCLHTHICTHNFHKQLQVKIASSWFLKHVHISQISYSRP